MSPERIDSLLTLAASGDLDAIRSGLIDEDDIDRRGTRGWTLLIAASRNGHADLVDWLLAAGADPNRANPMGTAPLMYAKTHAFASGDTRIMRSLLDAGADPHHRDAAGLTAADYTRQRAHLVIDTLETHTSRGTTG